VQVCLSEVQKDDVSDVKKWVKRVCRGYFAVRPLPQKIFIWLKMAYFGLLSALFVSVPFKWQNAAGFIGFKP